MTNVIDNGAPVTVKVQVEILQTDATGVDAIYRAGETFNVSLERAKQFGNSVEILADSQVEEPALVCIDTPVEAAVEAVIEVPAEVPAEVPSDVPEETIDDVLAAPKPRKTKTR